MSGMFGKLGMGWSPDYPDFRGHTLEKNEVFIQALGQTSIKAMLIKVGVWFTFRTSLVIPLLRLTYGI